jgi:prepilin-type N-terminal cleavage/methylation domain-containing protein
MRTIKITPPVSASPPLKIRGGKRGVMIPEDGFTLVELMITMVVFVLAMVAASQIFTGILTQFKQQSSIAGSNIEGIAGLELLRHDVEQAGFGLFWNSGGSAINYKEAATASRYDPTNTNGAIAAVSPSAYNDAPANVPRAVVVGKGLLMNNSDILVIKATNVATNATSQKWEYIVNNGAANNPGGGSSAELLGASDYAIIINPSTGANISNQNVLMSNGGYGVQLNNSFSFNGGPFNTPFEPPASSYTAYIAYGISATGPLGMPFNRADFYIKRPADIPSRCAPGTGVLYKGVVAHDSVNGGVLTDLPLLDCVLDMQVVLALDQNGGGSATSWWGVPTDVFSLAADQIRSQLKEIRIYLIVQEGQKDITYTYVNPDPTAPTSDKNMVYVKDPNMGNVYGTTKAGYTVPDLNYRWKLQTIIITPYNLRGS